nr:hypothetical protein [Candidatus Eremiobacteraeota bacterium]
GKQMTRMQARLRFVAAAALFIAPVAASAETLTGQVVDLGTYVTRDHNMDAMHGSMPAKKSMDHDSMAHESMGHACPPTLGLVTHGGAGLYVLITQMGTKTGEMLCKKIGRSVKLEGTVYDKNGMHAFLVSAAP